VERDVPERVPVAQSSDAKCALTLTVRRITWRGMPRAAGGQGRSMTARRPALILSLLTAAALGAVAVRARGRLGAAAGATAQRLRPGSAGRGRTASPAVQETFTCECGQAYRVSGTGRHRLYWPEGAGERDALLTPECVSCERPLPTT
jgi:hypothetical protein